MPSHHDVQVHLLKELRQDVHSEHVRHAAFVRCPSDHRRIRVRPENIAEQTCNRIASATRELVLHDSGLVSCQTEILSSRNDQRPRYSKQLRSHNRRTDTEGMPSSASAVRRLTCLLHVARPRYPLQLIQRPERRRQATVTAEDLVVDQGSHGHAVEHVLERLPQLHAVTSFA